MSFSLGNVFHDLAHSIAKFFGSHQLAIQTALAEAQSAAGIATGVATALGEPASVTGTIGKVADGLTLVSSTVTAESNAQTLQDHAANLAKLTTDLVSSGDIGIKNAATQAAVGKVALKVQGVVGALSVASTVAPGSSAPATETAAG